MKLSIDGTPRSGCSGPNRLWRGRGLARGRSRLRSDCIGGVWETLEQGNELSLSQRAKIGLCLTFAGQNAQRIVDLACGIVGNTTLFQKSPLERLRRDVIAISSHIVHQRKTYWAAGRIMLGVDAGPTFF